MVAFELRSTKLGRRRTLALASVGLCLCLGSADANAEPGAGAISRRQIRRLGVRTKCSHNWA
jgi:hypothetical protein